MFTLKKTENDPALEKAIADVYAQMEHVESADAEEYAKMVDQLTKLYKLKEINSSGKLSADAKATIAANLGGILLIVAHERSYVIASKAINFVSKLK